jgi:hypothetical protein
MCVLDLDFYGSAADDDNNVDIWMYFPGANPTTASYNATSRLVRFERISSLAMKNALACRCKFKCRRIGSWLLSQTGINVMWSLFSATKKSRLCCLMVTAATLETKDTGSDTSRAYGKCICNLVISLWLRSSWYQRKGFINSPNPETIQRCPVDCP